jgi:methyl-accepting chemotaxis protein
MRFNSIKAKLTAAIVLAMVITVSVLGAVNYWNTKQVVLRDMEENLASLSQHNAEKLGLWLDIRKSELAVLANSPTVVDGNLDSAINFLKAENKRNSVYSFFFVIDPDGNAVLTTGAKTNVADRPYFQQAKTGKIVISNPVISKVDGKPVIVVAAPIMKDQKITGVLAATVTLGDMIKLVGAIKIGDSGYAYVVQNDGLIIFHPSEKLAMKHNGLKDTSSGASLKTVIEKMVKGEKGVSKYTFDGVDKYAAFSPIPGTTWSLAVTAPVREMTAKLNTLLWSTLVILLIVLSAAVIFSLVIATSFTRPLLAMNLLLQDISQGNLTKRLEVTSNDELGETCRNLNTFVEKMHGIISHMAMTSTHVSTAAVQVNATSRQMAASADNVAAQVGTVATAGEEMAATSGDIAQNCQMAADESKEANEVAMAGAKVVEETIAVMNSIAERVKNSAKTVESLGARSDQIGEIVGTIEDIADQTNLLALNAAIEAARAGEQGRGFAVVADEVRALAERTTKATREIGEMIKAIQQETKGAVVTMEEGVSEVAKGTDKAAGSGRALEQILEKINAVTSQIHLVAVAAEEQTATTAEISNNMHQITEVIAVTSHGAQESATAAAQLNGNAEELQRLVGQFRLM